jgi:hypothetical protein
MTRLILMFCAMMMATGLQAQSYYMEEERTFYGGPIVGANFTQVDGDNYAGYAKVGMNMGATVYIKMGSGFAANMEILYVQKGCKGKPKESGVKGVFLTDYDSKLNYAEVPFQLFYVDDNGHHFGVGASYAQLISATESVTTNPANYFNLDGYTFRKYDVNFLLSANLRVRKGLFLNARFAYSVLPIRTNIPGGLGRTEQYNNGIALRLLYLFGGF